MMTETELRDLMERTYRPLFYQIQGFVGAADAEDILQDVYYRAWLHLVLDDRDPMHWLKRVTWNRVNSILKRRYALSELSLDEMTEDGFSRPAAPSSPDAVEWVRSRIWTLTPMRRSVLWLRDVAGWSDDRIAGHLGITATTVRRHASMARQQLMAAI